MKEGPDIAYLGAAIGDPARAAMLNALMSGKALTASELAAEAGVTSPTASSHLAKLEASGLVSQRKQGRHRYYSLADDDVGAMLEAVMGLAAKRGHMRTRTGPRNPELRKARVCYDHLAGEFGVRLFDSFVGSGFLTQSPDTLSLTAEGRRFISNFGIDLDEIDGSRRPLCKSCLDWSARRSHLAGALGSAFLGRLYDVGWASRLEGSRIVRFTAEGERRFLETFVV